MGFLTIVLTITLLAVHSIEGGTSNDLSSEDEVTPTADCGERIEEDEESGIGSLNPKISVYLNTFEKIKQEAGDDVDVQGAMDIIKQLITQSWIHTLQPSREYIPRGPNVCLTTIEEELAKKIIDLKKETVEDAIILYTSKKETEISKKFEADKISLVDNEKTIRKNMQANKASANRISNQKELKENQNKLQTVESLQEIHQLATKMYLQSYLLNFIPQPYSSTFVIQSRVFPVPSLDLTIFIEG